MIEVGVVMERLHTTLIAFSKSEEIMQHTKVLKLMDVLKGMMSLHAHNLHLISLKPENIMLDKEGRVRLVGLGVTLYFKFI